jgi:hypothetical protein
MIRFISAYKFHLKIQIHHFSSKIHQTMKAWKFLTVLTSLLVIVGGELHVFPAEEVEDCTKGGKSKYIDWSGLTYDAINDTLFFINGSFFCLFHS